MASRRASAVIGHGIETALDALLFAIGFALIIAPVVVVGMLAWGARWRVRLWARQQVASLAWRRERRSAGYNPDEPF